MKARIILFLNQRLHSIITHVGCHSSLKVNILEAMHMEPLGKKLYITQGDINLLIRLNYTLDRVWKGEKKSLISLRERRGRGACKPYIID